MQVGCEATQHDHVVNFLSLAHRGVHTINVIELVSNETETTEAAFWLERGFRLSCNWTETVNLPSFCWPLQSSFRLLQSV